MIKIWRFITIITLPFLVLHCKTENTEGLTQPSNMADYSVRSHSGKTYHPAEPSETSLENYRLAKVDYEENTGDLNSLIWFGRRTAYLGRYAEAISIYSEGLEKFQNEARLYRHRGHRYLSIREYDKAIEDFSKAAELIKGKEDQVEQDGLPNKLDIPLSTLHGNIWYHLGLAHYLKHDFQAAKLAYENSLATSTNDDNIAANTHWLYMINRRLGDENNATEALSLIHDDMNVIENESYYNLCRFYKGLIPRDSLLNDEGSPSGDAQAYGLANWDLYEGRVDEALKGMQAILDNGAWSSFGFLAAEKDVLGIKGLGD